VPEDPKQETKDFDFTSLPISPALRTAFAGAFVARTKPSARVRSLSSACGVFRQMVSFADYLGGLVRPPTRPDELTSAQVQGWLLQRPQGAHTLKEFGGLKTTLRKMPGISAEFAEAMHRSHKRPKTDTSVVPYTAEEFRRILSAARFDARRAAQRIRAGRELLDQWRSGMIDRDQDWQRWRRGSLLDHIDRYADVPRYPKGKRLPRDWVGQLGTVEQHVTSLHLSTDDAAAFAVLLVGLTGQNPSTITSIPAQYHRPDGYTGHGASVIVELDKPRRGSRRHMDVPLASLPDWLAAPSEEMILSPDGPNRDDLHSSFGVYMLLHDLAAPARGLAGTGRLLTWWAIRGGRGVGAGFRVIMHSDLVHAWAANHDLPMARRPPSGEDNSPGGEHARPRPRQMSVTLARLRHTYLDLHQRPVAHTERTLANDYLLRHRGDITDYQRVVADVLDKEVSKARTRAALRTLSQAEVEQAHTDPRAVAARHGLDAATLKRLLDGQLDTVLAGCTDHMNSPHAPAGQPCRASFMLCLSCPCARALPHHLPLQAAVHDALAAGRDAMTPLRWAQRFALAHTQLTDLLDRAGHPALTHARNNITAEQRTLVERLLHHELDHR
jgi:hypothetical protein